MNKTPQQILDKNAAWRKSRKEKGLCRSCLVGCTMFVAKGNTHSCPPCGAQLTKREKRKSGERRKRNVCTDCGEALSTHSIRHCEEHRLYHRAAEAKYRGSRGHRDS